MSTLADLLLFDGGLLGNIKLLEDPTKTGQEHRAPIAGYGLQSGVLSPGLADVRYWHKSDIPTAPTNVRYRG
jgi:hypothetical protein